MAVRMASRAVVKPATPEPAKLPDPPVAPRSPVEAAVELWRPPDPPAADDPIPF